MCLLLISRGADLEVKMRGWGYEGVEERTALEWYGENVSIPITPQQREQRRQALREAFAKRKLEQELERLRTRNAELQKRNAELEQSNAELQVPARATASLLL